jgi:aspartyl-tRNA(Asn)/glutamyl-tRNA(Gln) amidotransferase subunit C
MISGLFFRANFVYYDLLRHASHAAMSLTPTQIQNIAHLARLELRGEEIPVYTDSLTRILGLVGELEKAQTAGVEPMAHPLTGQVQRLRADAVTEPNARDLYQRNAPQVEDGLYLVPKVIE